MTWGEFSWAVEGYRQRELDEWKRTRAILLQQHNMNTKHPIRNPEIFMKLDDGEVEKKWKPMPKIKGKRSRVLQPDEIMKYV